MATSLIQLWNQALSSAKIGARVTSVTENTKQANACSLWSDSVRTTLLQTAPWPFCKEYKTLALDSATPPENWLYAYSLPTLMLAPRYLTTGEKFELASTASGNVLFCNNAAAVLVCTMDRTDPLTWSPMFRQAFVAYLGARVARELNAKLSTTRELFDEATAMVEDARSAAGNEEQELYTDVPPKALQARGYSGPADQTLYYRYPYTTLEAIL